MASPEAHAPISKPPAVHRLEEDDGWDGSIEGDDADRKKFAHPAVMERMSSVANEQRAKFEVFLEWLVSNGAHFPDLYLKCYKSNVRGVHTRSVVPPSTQIMAIPLKCLITDATARATATGAKLKEIEYQLSAPNHNHVIVHILEGMERGDTFFQPFYDILPATFDNFPVFWSEEELEFLKGSDLVAQTRARIANIRDDYDAICAKLEGFDRFSFDQFLWCRTAVGSRNFSITVAGQKRTAMVPWADMLNHFRPRETSWTFDNAQGCFTMTSLRTLAKGQQVMDSYGKKCNSKFLLHYGFSIQSNREKDGTCMNQLPMHLNLKSDDPAIGAKSALLSRRRRFNMTMNYSDAGTKTAMQYARTAAATPEEIAQMQPGRAGRIMSLANEARMIDFIANAMRTQLARYPSTIEEDDARLASEGLEPFCNERNAIIVVRGEKEICLFWIQIADLIRPILVGTGGEGAAVSAMMLGGGGGEIETPADAAAALCGLSLSQREALVRDTFASQTTDTARFITAMHRALKYEGR